MIKKIVLGLLVSICIAGVTSVSANDASWKQVQKKGELVIGLDDAFPPMGFRVEDGTLVGFDVDVAEALGKRLGIKITWQPTAWDGVIHSLNSKKFDCIWNGMTITPERAKKVSFTRPYIMDGQIAVVKFNEKAIKSVSDLSGKTVGAQKGSSAISAVKKLSPAAKSVKEYADNPKALLDLEAGRIDAVIIDNVVGRYTVAKRLGKFKVLPGFISKEPFGVAFRQADATLLAKVQQEIDAMVKDGTMGTISKKWFSEDVTNPEKW